ENLKKDPRLELSRMAALLGAEANAQNLDRAVTASSSERMSEMESKQAGQWVATHRTRQDKPFVRKGGAGDWRSVLTAQTVAYMEARWGVLMKKLGYELATEASASAVELQARK
ncbi:MAG: sulfotransferase domain-containing protein, partial [Candidatus Sulfotelmatobacter sp.]